MPNPRKFEKFIAIFVKNIVNIVVKLKNVKPQ